MKRILVVVCLCSIAGCGGMKLDRPLQPDKNDWTQFGGSPSRTQVSSHELRLPLREVWRTDVNAGIGNGSPVVADSVLFIGTLKGELWALSVRDGRKAGSILLGESIPGSPVILSDGSVLVALSSLRESLQRFDPVTGKARWKVPMGDIESSPLVFGDRVFVCTTSGTVVCAALDNGRKIWTFELPDNTLRKGFHSGAALEQSTLVVGCDDGCVYGLNAADGTRLWRTNVGGAVMGSPVIDSGRVFSSTIHGTIAALDVVTGKIMWESNAGSPVYGSPAVGGGVVIAGDLTGDICAWRTSDGKRLWNAAAKGPVNTGAVIVGDIAVVGTLGRTVMALSLADGSIVWSTDVGGRVKSPAVVVDGRLFVATDDREVICFEGNLP